MTAPLISVVMAAYNGQAFIGDAIRSVLAQTFQDFELVIVDDGSTDDTVKIVEGFEDARIRLLRNERNLGISNTRNRGMAAARGPYIAAHDQDDLSLPVRLERHLAAFDSDPRVVLAAARVGEHPSGATWPPLPVPSGEALAWRLFTGSILTHSAICLRADALGDSDEAFYRQEYHYAEDFEMYHRLSECGRLVFDAEVLGVYRYHAENTSKTKRAEMEANGRRFLLSRYRQYLGRDFLGEGDIASIWRLCVLGEPAKTLAELDRVGEILDAHVAAFLERRQADADDRQASLSEASAVWWRLVRNSASVHGAPTLARYDAWPHLSQRRVPLLTRLEARVRARKRAV